MPQAFLLQPFHVGFEEIRDRLADALVRAGVTPLRLDLVGFDGLVAERLFEAIETADVVIADVTSFDPNVAYELGYAHAMRRPVVMISAEASLFRFSSPSAPPAVVYDPASFDAEAIVAAVQEALAEPQRFMRRPEPRADANRVFLSYSHHDIDILQRLLVHLRPLEREGLIDVWSDQRIAAGSDWKRNIEQALVQARAAILLVSADFLASDFIVDNELPPLLEGAAQRGSLILPLVVKPCRYLRDKHLASLQAVNDPTRPLAALTSVGQEQLLDQVAAQVERAMRQAS